MNKILCFSVIQVILILIGVCCWLFWFACYMSQMNPLIGPILNQRTLIAVKEYWVSTKQHDFIKIPQSYNKKPFLINCVCKIYFPFIIREPTIGLDKKCQKHFLNRRQILPTTTGKKVFIMLSSTTNENNGKFKQVYNNNGQWWNDFYTIKYA